MITIVDYKVGNLGSIQNMLKKIGSESIITSDPKAISSAKKLILPGVGSYDSGVNSLKKYKLWDVLNEKVLKEKTPVLGICLGMQLLCNSSEEGKETGLGWIDAEVIRFRPKDKKFKIPHMGWNYVHAKKASKLFQDMYEDPKFYFVHSYYVDARDDSSLAKATYEISFDAAVEKGNVLGTQFHPEKSHKFGMKLLDNFVQHY
ncbi:imidazole glycerol phosphate synthase subunit HisH [Ulvibacterium marinum]|uniref:imidazole glycerol phosphate synthase subunit HisH n=1 Tax=Ulvibacterium marinum TaxID=2419782 RepID=UPI002495A43E|nr:imidazole glycerol phosphate synthase subunit HisH [Ulvibacterium marinum]